MDPLSIIASTIAVLGATIKVSEGVAKIINSFNHLPNELIATSNDITDIRLVLAGIEESVVQEEALFRALGLAQIPGQLAITNNVPAAVPEAPSLVQRAQEKLIEIEDVIRKYRALQNTKGIGVLGRIRLLDRSKLSMLRNDLSRIKLNIVTHFSVKGSTCALQSALLVARLSGKVSEAARESEEQRRLLLDILQRFNSIDGIEGEQRRSNDLIQILTTQLLQNGPGFQQVEMAPLHAAPDSTTTELAPIFEQRNDYNSSIFKLDISRFRKNACRPFCSCVCHRRHRRRAPTLANKLLGSLFLGYSNLPFFAVKCDEPSCIQPSQFSATFTYYFPAWFLLKRMFSLVLMTTPLGDPGACLKVRKIQFHDFSIFRLASIGDWRRIKSLLDRRVEHPSTSWWGEWTPLHYAISNGHATVCKYLLSRNADPLIEDKYNQQSALEYAWSKILGKAYPPQKLLEFQSIFTDRECLEELGLTTLHKIILGLNGRDLESELLMHPSRINEQDNEGRTALSWAAQRGDVDRLNILLANGADPNIPSQTKVTPLHSAALALSPSCITPLIRANASINAIDRRGHTPLFEAIRNTDDLQYIQPLIASGADVNASTVYQYTPLMFAACQNRTISAGYLLDNGAAINVKGQLGRTALHFAIEYNAHDVLRLLLERGADCAQQAEESGPTIAHFAARHADLETLKILTEGLRVECTVDDLEAEDQEGMVLEELVNQRVSGGTLEGFAEAFQNLLDRLVPLDGTEAGEREREEDQDEVWEDATETFDRESEGDETDVWEEAVERHEGLIPA